MGAAFILTLGLSLTGGATCLLAFASGKLVRKKIRSSWLCYLWLIVLLCFIVPVPLNLPFAYGGFRDVSAALSSAMTVQEHPPVSYVASDPAPSFALVETSIPEKTAGPSGAAPADSAGIFRFLPYVWLAGATAILLWTLSAYILMLHRLQRTRTLLTPGRVPVYSSKSITTPLLVGILRPVIYLPSGFLNSELAIRHELCHLRRGDLWLKWLVQLAVCAHWFNPLAWLMRRELNRLCELACDTSAIRRLNDDDRRTYGIMLLDTAGAAADRGYLLVSSLGRDKKILQERLGEIMKTQKVSRKTVAAMSALTIIIMSAAVIFGSLFSGCANQQAAPREDSVTPAVTEAAPSVTPNQSAPSSVSADTYDLLDVSAAPPSAAIIVTTGIYEVLPLDNDPALIGTWELVDTVDSSDAFDPEMKMYSIGEDSKIYLYIGNYNALSMMVSYTSFEGDKAAEDKQMLSHFVIQSNDSYEIKNINGVTYIFVGDNSSGDHTDYAVFRKTADTVPQFFANPEPVPDRPPWVIVTTPSP